MPRPKRLVASSAVLVVTPTPPRVQSPSALLALATLSLKVPDPLSARLAVTAPPLPLVPASATLTARSALALTTTI